MSGKGWPLWVGQVNSGPQRMLAYPAEGCVRARSIWGVEVGEKVGNNIEGERKYKPTCHHEVMEAQHF